MKLLILSRYTALGASSRLRLYQYLPYLQSRGLSITVEPLFDDVYLRGFYQTGHKNLAAILEAYWRRLRSHDLAQHYDVIWLEKESLPWCPYFAEKWLLPRNAPYVLDIDDAIFHQYDLSRQRLVRSMLGDKIARLMQHAALVLAGNDYLADYARRAGAPWVEVLPTVVDTKRYVPDASATSQSFTVGWIGSPATAHYLKLIEKPLARFCAEHPCQIHVIGADPRLSGLDYQVLTWREDSEVDLIRQLDVGIMPLSDTPWERGKCGYKLIQYMACAKPVIASPVGVNRHIVEHGVNGFLAATSDEWLEALRRLASAAALRTRLGEAGREKVARDYALEVTGPKLLRWFQDLQSRAVQ